MKKILYVWDKHYPWDVRTEKITESLALAGYDVHVLARWKGEEKENEQFANVKIRRVGYKSPAILTLPIYGNLFWNSAIRKAVKELKPDLIIVREIILGIQTGKIAKSFNIPIIMDMAENYPAAMRDWKEYNQNAVLRFLVHSLKIPDWIEKKSVKLMSGIITVCKEQNSRLSDSYSYPLQNCVVVHNTPLKGSITSNPLTQNQIITFCHHGHLTSEKDVSKFVKAFIAACDKKNNLYLKLAGGGHCLDDLKQIVSASKHENKIDFLGKYDYKDLSKILASCNIGVIPYQISDFNQYTIHNKIFDYFAAGRPVLVSENNPQKRVIEETNAGWIADCENIEELTKVILSIADTDLQPFSKNAIEASNKYCWENDFKSLLDFVNKFIK